MRTEVLLLVLPSQVLNQAIAYAKDTTALVHATMDLITSITDALLSMQFIASTGTVGEFNDNALADNVNGCYKRAHPYPPMQRWCRRGNRNLRVGYAVERVTASTESQLPYADRGEIKLWEHNPAHEVMENKAHA
ncbi:hypothetical protein [Corynebacterium anserum]|uniref:Uncharacterized protein n=1 Tax=Corynebacterium anserum TaxID=2684406 RepID=A0A7G7YPF0_9CORY|nr:hypothetical protein [Corynebacterium anserum]MBC2681988.1 hypothetical protein [Corynebacterium anserum]QNH96370.1 hypothetical protein GP473_06570 [Corynebacterium anserum]